MITCRTGILSFINQIDRYDRTDILLVLNTRNQAIFKNQYQYIPYTCRFLQDYCNIICKPNMRRWKKLDSTKWTNRLNIETNIPLSIKDTDTYYMHWKVIIPRQSLAFDAPSTSVVKAPGHTLHSMAPKPSWYLPLEQYEHGDIPSGDQVPGTHASLMKCESRGGNNQFCIKLYFGSIPLLVDY